jgi:hypothetical protein
MMNLPDRYPLLEFPVGQVQCLHSQHQLKAAEELLLLSDQWWTVDLYLNSGQVSDPLYYPILLLLSYLSKRAYSNLHLALIIDISSNL